MRSRCWSSGSGRCGRHATSATPARSWKRFADTAVELLGTTLTGKLIHGLVSELVASPELARAYRETVVDPRMADLATVVARGIERGDLRPDTDVRLVHQLLIGPIYYRLLFSGAPLDKGLGGRVANAVMRAFARHANT